jgi:hypothetical protein
MSTVEGGSSDSGVFVLHYTHIPHTLSLMPDTSCPVPHTLYLYQNHIVFFDIATMIASRKCTS